MARKRAPKPLPHAALREAAGWPSEFNARSGIQVGDTDTLATEVEQLEQWVLRDHPAAQQIAPRGRGQPPKWERMLSALRWLREHGIFEISDAPGSRCVRVLGQFLDQERGGKRHRGERDGSAEGLAGTLRSLAGTIELWPTRPRADE